MQLILWGGCAGECETDGEGVPESVRLMGRVLRVMAAMNLDFINDDDVCSSPNPHRQGTY
jgi:hypothetical protein